MLTISGDYQYGDETWRGAATVYSTDGTLNLSKGIDISAYKPGSEDMTSLKLGYTAESSDDSDSVALGPLKGATVFLDQRIYDQNGQFQENSNLKVAAGVTDYGGAATNFRSYYGVVTYDQPFWSASAGYAKARTNSDFNPLNGAFANAAFKVLPWLGDKIAQDSESYRYLAESIRMHPDAQTLKEMMLGVGFDEVETHRMTGGIVALHIGVKY
jgi:hypothetical protein